MTESKSTTKRDRYQEIQELKLGPARVELRKLENAELATLLLEEFSRRRLDEHDNPTEERGLYDAATTTMNALLGQIPTKADIQKRDEKRRPRFRDLDPEQAAYDDRQAELVERYAAVGRGALLNNREDQEVPKKLRELADLVVGVRESPNFADADRAGSIAKSIEKWFGHAVDEQAIVAALRQPPRAAVARVAMAAGILPGKVTDEHARRAAKDRLRKLEEQGQIHLRKGWGLRRH